MPIHTTYRQHPEVLTTPLSNEEMVLLHMRTHQYYTLNATGARIWSILASAPSVPQLSEALSATYALSPTEAQSHVEELLQQLTMEQLVETVEAT